MKKTKKDSLQRAGWKVETTNEFLGLTKEEAALIEMKLALAWSLKQRRSAQDLTQAEFAKRLGSSQSRVAKMEAADATVSLELLVRSLLMLRASRQEVGRIIGRKMAAPAAQDVWFYPPLCSHGLNSSWPAMLLQLRSTHSRG